MNLKKIIRRNLLEAVGVPSNIDVAAREIFSDIIQYLTQNSRQYNSVNDINNKELIINGPYKFSDHVIKNITVKFELNDSNKTELLGLYVKNSRKINIPKLTIYRSDNLYLGINIMCDLNDNLQTFINFLISKKPMMIGSIAHEIKHDYDSSKKPDSSLETNIDYNAHNEGFGPIMDLNLVVIGNYYLHNFENSVRPSEVYTELVELGVTKKDFVQKIKSTSFMQYIDFYKNLSYEKFISLLNDDYEEIVSILINNDIDVDKTKVEYNIQLFLQRLRISLLSKQLDVAHNYVNSSLSFNDIFNLANGLETEGIKFFKKYMNKITQGGKFSEENFDYERSSKMNKEFYTKKINNLVKISNKLYKKIAKIYSILPDEPNTKNLSKKKI